MIDLQLAVRILVKLRQLRSHEHWSRNQLEKFQADQLNHLRRFAYEHSPFYHKFHQGLSEAPLDSLPVLTKSTLMENFDSLVTDDAIKLKDVQAYVAQNHPEERFRGRFWVTATSGSSGHPGIFLFNQAEWIYVMASFARAQEWAGLGVNPLRHTKLATVASPASWHMSGQVAATIHGSWMPEIQIAATEPLPLIVERLNDWQPQILIAYASMAHSLAEEQHAGRLQIAPQHVFTSSEVLTEMGRKRIEQAWGNVVFNEYAATETATIAAECRNHHGLHLYEDLLLVEVVDENHRQVPIGATGEKLLVTVLFNRTQPLIRYELTDSVRLGTEQTSCDLPFQLIQAVAGRTEDTLYMPSVGGSLMTVHPLLFHQVMDTLYSGEWQVIYDQRELKVLLKDASNDVAQQVSTAIHTELANIGALSPPINVELVALIPKSTNGKSPLIRYRPLEL